MHLETTIRLAARTDTGRVRNENEDNFIVGSDIAGHNWKFSDYMVTGGEMGCLMAIADGMGGASAGEVASQIAIEEVKSYFDQLGDCCVGLEVINEHLKKAVMMAHHAIVNYVESHPENDGMGTTIMLVWVIGATAYICWSGDSRCYCYNHFGEIELLTDDHSVVWEMVLTGELTKQEAAIHNNRHIITQSLGVLAYPPKPDFRIFDLVQGDRLLLCSDGLNSMLVDEEIQMLIEKSPKISSNCRDLIEAANLAGGEDNITLVMYELVEIVSTEKSVSTRSPHLIDNKEKDQKKIWKFSSRNLLIIIFFIALVIAGAVGYIFL